MTRMKTLLLPAVAVGLLACGEHPTSIGGLRATIDLNDQTYVFKVQVGSTWYPLISPGDFIAGHPSDSTWTIQSDGTTHIGIAVSAIALDTVGWNTTSRQLYARYPFIGANSKVGEFLTVNPSNTPVRDLFMARNDTLMLDNISATSSSWHTRSAGAYATWTQNDFKSDNVGSFRFATCATAPTCVL